MRVKIGNESAALSIIVVDVGNTHTAAARWLEGEVADVGRVQTDDRAQVTALLAGLRGRCADPRRQAIVIASVVPEATEWLGAHVRDEMELRPFLVGDNTPLPMPVAVRQPTKVGVDRVCSAAAAYARLGQACVIADIGSAVTVDVIDDEGVFRGGAILPGLAMQARALAEFTAVLPRVEPAVPESVIGADTEEAISSGICYGLAGAIRNIVEQIATEQGRWPQVVVTGGGAETLRPLLEFADRWVPNLCLMGVGLAYVKRIHDSAAG